LRKNSDFDLVLKGRGFSRTVSAAKSIAALQIAEKPGFRRTAPKGASQFKELTASLKRCPDTKLEFFSNLFSRCGLHSMQSDFFRSLLAS